MPSETSSMPFEYVALNGRRVRATHRTHPIPHLEIRYVDTGRKARLSPLMSRERFDAWKEELTSAGALSAPSQGDARHA